MIVQRPDGDGHIDWRSLRKDPSQLLGRNQRSVAARNALDEQMGGIRERAADQVPYLMEERRKQLLPIPETDGETKMRVQLQHEAKWSSSPRDRWEARGALFEFFVAKQEWEHATGTLSDMCSVARHMFDDPEYPNDHVEEVLA